MHPDSQPPKLQCPENVEAATDERRITASVSWNAPNATDNSGLEVRGRQHEIGGGGLMDKEMDERINKWMHG